MVVSMAPRSSSKLSNWNVWGASTTPSSEWKRPAMILRIFCSSVAGLWPVDQATDEGGWIRQFFSSAVAAMGLGDETIEAGAADQHALLAVLKQFCAPIDDATIGELAAGAVGVAPDVETAAGIIAVCSRAVGFFPEGHAFG